MRNTESLTGRARFGIATTNMEKKSCDCGKYHEDDCENREKVCEECEGTGFIEIMGGSESEEWGVIGTRPCKCQEEHE